MIGKPVVGAPSRAALRAADVPAGKDATLSGLSVDADDVSALAPGFDPNTRYYQIVEDDGSSAAITATTTQAGATVAVRTNGNDDPVTSGAATAAVLRGRNDVVITVTSADGTTTGTYFLTIWRAAAPKIQIVRVDDATSTVYGGVQATLTLRYAQLPNSCAQVAYVGDDFAYVEGAPVYDPSTGLLQETLDIPESANDVAGKVDLSVASYCNTGDHQYGAYSTDTDAITYTAGLHVDSLDAPAEVTSATPMTIHGAGITEYGDTWDWMTDSRGNAVTLDSWDFTGNDNEVIYADYDYNATPIYTPSGPRTVHVGYCPFGTNDFDATICTSVFSKTINWVAPVPSGVSFTPASGPQDGGTTIRIRGKFLYSGTESLTVKVGDQPVTSFTYLTYADNEDNDFAQYTQDPDVLEFTAPASPITGAVPVTVTNDWGTTVAHSTYTYSAKPAISSIAPATVADSGGSLLTVDGSNFGTAGTPKVIVDGTPSPLVRRVSATELTAVTPASSSTGPVDVTVSSPQGGGISAAAPLTLVAPSTLPTITSVSPSSGHATDTATVTGTGFGPAGTSDVSIDGQWALVTSSSATKITFEVPATDATGATTLTVGTVTGTAGKAAGFTVLGDPAITGVTPSTIASYATGSAAKIAIDGTGLGATGTVKVGSAAAVAYTSTAGGTHIAGIAVPTTKGGPLPVVVTPKGATTPLQSAVTVAAPVFSYVGPDPYAASFGAPDLDTGRGGLVLSVPTTGGTTLRLQGSGFGPAGTLKVDKTAVQPTSWADGLITFAAPAHALGTVSITVTPAHASLSAVRSDGIQYVAAPVGQPTFSRITSTVDYHHDERNDFDPVGDATNLFTVTGTNLAGTTASDTTVNVNDPYTSQNFDVVPTQVSATAVTFAAPRGFSNGGWKDVSVTTDVGSVYGSASLNYLQAGTTLSINPARGYCGKTSATATGSVTYSPTTITVGNTGSAFGSSGTVSFDGVAVTPTSYAAGSVTFSTAGLATALSNPWGGKSIVITPTNTSLPPQTLGFTCAVTPSVTTTANGSNNALSVPAGTAYTIGNTTTGFIGTNPFTAPVPTGYEYVTAADFAASAFTQHVHNGVPTAAGDYDVQVSLGNDTYDRAPYLFTSGSVHAVHVTIVGTPITLTPVSKNGSSFTYQGQLGDGSNGSPNDFGVTPSSTTDPITAVTWEYRDSVCESGPADQHWIDGLPKDVATSSPACGGDGTTASKWDVRVKTFQMTTSGTDRSVFYDATRPTTQITITPRDVAISTVRADKVYDGTTAAPFGALTFTGALDGDDLSLAGASAGTFADAAPGVNKPVTLSGPVTLAGGSAADYTLTNPSPVIVGTISKASAVLALAASTESVLLSKNTPVTITSSVTDARTGDPVSDSANAAPVVLTSQTPSVCTVSGTTVTAVAAGTCVIAGTQAASTNYAAATASSDPSSTTETVTITVFPAPQTIQVVADDLTIATGDSLDPTSQVSGLFQGDSVDGVTYDYYSGSTLLTAPPTEPGRYRVVPTGGSLTAADPSVYSNPTSFTYVAGTLVITALPPTITAVSPDSGTTVGGTTVTITGTQLDTVRTITIGSVTLHAGDFTVSADGTSLTFRTPKVAHAGVVDLTLAAKDTSAADVYTYVTGSTKPTPPVHRTTKPGTPRHEAAAAHDRSATVTFLPPKSDGGSHITRYQVSTDGGRTWHTVSTHAGKHGTRTVTLRHLSNGVRYRVKVRAVNKNGAGKPSSARTVLPNAPALGTHRHHPASEVGIPGNPNAYHGKQVRTRAYETSHNGTWAHQIPSIGARQLTAGEAVTLSKDSLFDFDSAHLTKAGRAEVRFLASHLRLAHAITCEGYTDYAGQASHEQQLSSARALAVCRGLKADGAHVSIVTHGYGRSRPVVIGGTPQSRAANRRVVVLVTR